jgi:hypothetical protein
MIGFYIAFIITLGITGYAMVEGFVSKDMLNRGSFYMDGHVYEINKR